MKTTPDLSPELLAELQAAATRPDTAIDTDDVPETPSWTGAVRGRFHPPRKKLVSVRYDEDVLAYFKAQGPGYQTAMNRILRAAMLRALRRRARQA